LYPFLILPGQGSYINPKFIGKKKGTIIQGYVTDIITDVTLNWLDKKRDKTKPFMMMYLHKAPHRPWWPSPEKFAEYYEKEFPEPETLFDDYSGRGTGSTCISPSPISNIPVPSSMSFFAIAICNLSPYSNLALSI
jgi:hypothetical protein